jgi:hypothetical protein
MKREERVGTTVCKPNLQHTTAQRKVIFSPAMQALLKPCVMDSTMDKERQDGVRALLELEDDREIDRQGATNGHPSDSVFIRLNLRHYPISSRQKIDYLIYYPDLQQEVPCLTSQ